MNGLNLCVSATSRSDLASSANAAGTCLPDGREPPANAAGSVLDERIVRTELFVQPAATHVAIRRAISYRLYQLIVHGVAIVGIALIGMSTALRHSPVVDCLSASIHWFPGQPRLIVVSNRATTMLGAWQRTKVSGVRVRCAASKGTARAGADRGEAMRPSQIQNNQIRFGSRQAFRHLYVCHRTDIGNGHLDVPHLRKFNSLQIDLCVPPNRPRK